jgi:hypothetical protein
MARAPIRTHHCAIVEGMLAEVPIPSPQALAVRVNAHSPIVAVRTGLAAPHVLVSNAGVGAVGARIFGRAFAAACRYITCATEATVVGTLAQ